MEQTSAHLPYLDITVLTEVARGAKRNVYLIHDLPSVPFPVVLKVPRYQKIRKNLSRGKRFVHDLFPFADHFVITREVEYIRRLERQTGGALAELPVTRFASYAETSAGRGALWEALLNENQALAPTLQEIADAGRIGEVIEPLNRFVEQCFALSLVASDLHAGNLALVVRGGRKQLLLVDGFGDHRLISLRSLSRWYNAKSLVKKFEKVASQTGLRYAPETRRFSLPD